MFQDKLLGYFPEWHLQLLSNYVHQQKSSKFRTVAKCEPANCKNRHKSFSVKRYVRRLLPKPQLCKKWLPLPKPKPMLQNLLPKPQLVFPKHPVLNSSIGHRCFLHLPNQNDLPHAGYYGIHKKLSDKSALPWNLLLDLLFPVLRVIVMFQIYNCSY